MRRAAIVLALVVSPSAARAELRARETADLVGKGHGAVGLFEPLRIGVRDDVEVVTHPWLDLALAPNVATRVALRRGPIRVAGEYGLSVPTGGMRLLGGYLFPSWETSERRVGWFVVPSVGVAVSTGTRGIATARLDTAVGIPLGRNDATPLDGYAPIELALAPALHGTRTHAGLAYDHPVTPWLRVRGGLDAWLLGGARVSPPKSPWIFAAWIGADVALSRAVRIAVGAILYDHDQRRKDVVREDGRWRRVPVRSRDVHPTLDVVVSW